MIVAYTLIIPILYTYFFLSFEKVSFIREGFAFIVGIFGASIAALVMWWVTGFFPLDSASFFLRLIIVFMLESVVPFIVLPLILLLFFENRFREHVSVLLSLEFGIAAVFLPYIMLSGSYSDQLWSAVIIPLNYVGFLFVLDFSIRLIMARRPDSVSDLFPEILLPFVVLLTSDILKMLWFYSFSAWFYWPLATVLILVALSLRLYKYFR